MPRLELVGGRHDEVEIYGGPAGDLGLTGGPGSLSREINGDLGQCDRGRPYRHPDGGTASVRDARVFTQRPTAQIRMHARAIHWVGAASTFGSTEAPLPA
ncbi:MAG: hypothetical protein IPG64_20810 [Haliea sp.]|nr:hypothetical protein [Haliea sp.]